MRSLKSRIFLFFLALLMLAMALIFILIYRTTYSHTLRQLEEQLSAGYQLFNDELQTRRLYQGSTSELITQDFGLRSEVAAFDDNKNIESLRVTLNNFRERSHAHFVLATAPDGHILASTDRNYSNIDNLPLNPEQMKSAFHEHDAIVVLNQQLFHAFIAPIYAPAPNLVGWLVLGYVLDDATATHLSTLTGLHVSFLTRTPKGYQVLSSSLNNADRQQLARMQEFHHEGHMTMNSSGKEQVLYVARLKDATATEITVVLQRSLTEALRDYEALQWQLAFIFILTLCLTVLGAFVIASSVTRPLSDMVAYVRLVASGDYNAQAPAESGHEIGLLTREFIKMKNAVSEREAAVAYSAFHDHLTGLPNRLNFQDVLLSTIAQTGSGSGPALLVMGLNNFKDINDTLGHISGDHLLQQLARRLNQQKRPGDTVARLGGDAFAILLHQVERHEVIPLTLHYRAVLSEPFHIEGIALTVNASMGITTYPEHGENPALLLQRTEIAMYVSKEKRLPYALYSNLQNRYSLLRLSLMSELKGALERGELLLHYQPKLDLKTQRIVAVEALVRWQHPVHGFVRPDDFVPLAEQTGNVRFLTNWALNSALAQNRIWRDQGIALSTAVNISVVDLQDPELLDRIDKALTQYRIPAEALVLEITEGAVMHDVSKAVELLAQLHRLGVKLSIDDYGTGYSSMAQLKRLPVDELKIDKSFVLDIAKNNDDSVIVRSTIELGHNMDLRVVAEGVETHEALQILTQLGCDLAQGYYLSKPLSVSDFDHWLKTGSYGH